MLWTRVGAILPAPFRTKSVENPERTAKLGFSIYGKVLLEEHFAIVLWAAAPRERKLIQIYFDFSGENAHYTEALDFDSSHCSDVNCIAHRNLTGT